MTCGCPDCEADRLQKPCPYREQVAAWMLENGFATGHGDTVEDLLNELSWQIAEVRQREENRKALAPKFLAANEDAMRSRWMAR